MSSTTPENTVHCPTHIQRNSAFEHPDMPQNTNAPDIDVLRNIIDALCVNVGRTRTSVKGYHYPLASANPILRPFPAILNPDLADILPKIDVTTRFLNPNDAPIYSTVVAVDHRRFLIVGYFDNLLPENLNVKEVFPHLPWHGELAVFSLGKRKHLLSRPAGSRYVIAKAVALYVWAVIEMRLAGYEAPFQIAYPSTFGIL